MEITLTSTSLPRTKGNPIKNKVGLTFGTFTVIEFSHVEKRRSYWKCVCSCGEMRIVANNNIKPKRNSKCLGCQRLSDLEAFTRACFRDYKTRANKNGFEFSISLQFFQNVSMQNCYYCGDPPKNLKKRAGRKFAYNGLDRVNSSKGYTEDNCRPCCTVCNTMKLDYSESFFLNHIKKVTGRF